MGHVLHRSQTMEFPTAVHGDGCYIVDSNGKRYLDASGGAAVSCLGHSHPAVIDAIQKQLARLPYVHSSFFTTEPAEELGDLLAEMTPPDLSTAYFVCGGSEAVEAAIMMARQYFLEIGEPRRRRVIGRRNSYHGMTMGALAVGDTYARRQPYEPMLVETTHVSTCFPYREKRKDETDEDYGKRISAELEAAIQRLGPDTVAAFIAETVVGSNGGAVPPVPGYFKSIREICDRYGVLLILDEIFCGTGRTGTMLACEQEHVAPDLAMLAKGLGAGYQPLGALLISDRIINAIRQGSGSFKHGHTYSGHAAACAAGVAVLRTIKRERLLENVVRQGEFLSDALHERFGNHRHVGDIRGRGLLQAVELVSDRTTGKPFDPSLRLHARIKAAAMNQGLMCYPQGGTIDGINGDHVTLAPPYNINEPQVVEIVDKLGKAIDVALDEVTS